MAPDEVPPVAPDTSIPDAAPTPAPQPSQPAPAATPLPAKRESVYGIPVPGKLGFMKSPHHPEAGLIDYRGLPSAQRSKTLTLPARSFWSLKLWSGNLSDKPPSFQGGLLSIREQRGVQFKNTGHSIQKA